MKNLSPHNYLLKLLTRREHSVSEVREKLRKKFPAEIENIEKLIKKFVEKNWLSDSRFCEVFVRDQILKKSGPKKIIQKLFKRGVDLELIREKIEEEYPASDQAEIIMELAKNKYETLKKRGKGESELELRQKILRFLMGRGFDFDMVKKAAKKRING